MAGGEDQDRPPLTCADSHKNQEREGRRQAIMLELPGLWSPLCFCPFLDPGDLRLTVLSAASHSISLCHLSSTLSTILPVNSLLTSFRCVSLLVKFPWLPGPLVSYFQESLHLTRSVPCRQKVDPRFLNLPGSVTT